MAVDQETPPVEVPAPAGRRTPLAVAVTLVVALVVGGLAAWAWHWRTHPTVLPEVGNSVGMKMSLDKRPTMYFGVTYPDGEGETVTIDSVSPRVFENTARAGFAFYLCNEGDEGFFGVASPEDFEQFCPRPVPVVRDTTFAVGETERTHLVMGVTVHRPGRVEINGVEVTYSVGLQRGTQATGLEFVIESR